MCGLAGFLCAGPEDFAGLRAEDVLVQMAQAVAHRGPDAQGTFVDADAGLGMAHRRLSIIDLSPAGSQPMASACGRYVIAYNGEVYNYLDLRRRLESEGNSPDWRGGSDTEVVLAAFVVWGAEKALRAFNGMFALALWDRQERKLVLARDRFGEKPLYFGKAGKTLLFGSELKALQAHPAWAQSIDHTALAAYVRTSYVPAPLSIFTGIGKLPSGSFVTIKRGDLDRGLPAPVAYWNLSKETSQPRRALPEGGAGDTAVVDELDQILRRAVAMRMIADVPLGAFLSGGVDSSVIVALMQAQSPRPLKTFTIGFEADTHDEARYAKAVAKHLGTDHTEHYVGPAEALAHAPGLGAIFDEPFADSSQIPTLLVSALARKSVTVALTGDAGDEVFGGYNRYLKIDRYWRSIEAVPFWMRKLAAGAVGVVPAVAIDAFARAVLRRNSAGDFSDTVRKGAQTLAARSVDEAYHGFTSVVARSEDLLLHTAALESAERNQDGPRDPVERMMYRDTLSYLPDDILVKLDRSAMSVSLEGRIPFLDPEVVKFAWSLPLEMKVAGGRGKLILRALLDRYVPRTLIDRPKMGFGIPLDAWLRGPLSSWAADLLAPDAIRRQGFFDPVAVDRIWRQHRSGRANNAHALWNVLMFCSWLEGRPR